MGDILLMETRAFPQRSDAERALRDIYRDQWPCLVRETAHERLYRMHDLLAIRGCRDPETAGVVRSLFGIGLDGAAAFRRTELVNGRPFLITLQHTWALDPLARRLSRNPRRRSILLHIDSHDDLQPPSVFLDDDGRGFRAPVGEDLLRLDDGDAISRFVERGLIGIGGFLVPLLHAFDALHYVHVRPPGLEPRSERKALYCRPDPVVYFGGVGDRPSVRFGDSAGVGLQSAIFTDTLRVLDDLPADAPIFVDVDMDYFCNAYDDSAAGCAPMPSRNQLRERVHAVFSELADRLSDRNVELVTLALSPGFFPAIFWADCLELSAPACREILGRSQRFGRGVNDA